MSTTRHQDVGFRFPSLNSRRGFIHSFIFILETSMWLVQNSKAPPIYIANYRERTEEAGQREGWASQPSHSPGHGGAGSGGSLPPGQVSCLTPPGSGPLAYASAWSFPAGLGSTPPGVCHDQELRGRGWTELMHRSGQRWCIRIDRTGVPDVAEPVYQGGQSRCARVVDRASVPWMGQF